MLLLRINGFLELVLFCVTLSIGSFKRGFPRMIVGGFAWLRRTRLFYFYPFRVKITMLTSFTSSDKIIFIKDIASL